MPSSDDARTARIASAFAPGHITGWFVPRESVADPRARGSVGGGLTLARGVWATARFVPGGPSRVRLRARPRIALPISRDVARRLLRGRPGTLTVDLRHELPVGQGLGMSAAGALATALASARVLEVPRARAVEVAHLADLFGRGGLGGVAAILGGGLERRLEPGIPPWGAVRHRPWDHEILLVLAGNPLPSPPLLSDPGFLRRVRRAGLRAERTTASGLHPRTFLRAAERFTDEVGLASSERRAQIEALRSAGARVAQTMFGNVLYAVASTAAEHRALSARLTGLGLRATPVRVATHGARVERRAPSNETATLLKGSRSRPAP
jgi:pantoate kinase